ncbi:hypothetical protein MPSEU_000726000 [Mayamaea pseudoterrestris]|nr:hypothetical protein MPSEU_000726000 [Mayamaea pseudoterrestris]
MMSSDEQEAPSILPPLHEEQQETCTDDNPKDAASSMTLRIVSEMILKDALGRTGKYTGPVIATNEPENDSSTSLLLPHTDQLSLTNADGFDDSNTERESATGTMVYQEQENEHDDNKSSTTNAADTSMLPLEYTGPWRNGHWDGEDAHLLYRNGDVYHGSVQQSLRHGTGVMKWKQSGHQYTGQYERDLRHGQGSFAWADGALYQGSFERNHRSGYGTYFTPTVSYEGEWRNGVYHGKGVYKYQQDGCDYIYTGNFHDGKPHGIGKLFGGSIDGAVQHDGEWRDGQPVKKKTAYNGTTLGEGNSNKAPSNIIVVQNQDWHDLQTGDLALYRGLWDSIQLCPVGSGSLDYKQGPIKSYDGCFAAPGHLHGQGRLEWQNGDVYNGEFDHGHRHGQGQYVWADGRHYQGEFCQNLRHGHGRFMYPNDDFYEGNFEQGKRDGRGRFVFADGSVYEGEWKNGLYCGLGTLVQRDGGTYAGHFEAGVAHGHGIETSASGIVVYDGEWISGQRADSQGKVLLAEVAVTGDDEDSADEPTKNSLQAMMNSIKSDAPLESDDQQPKAEPTSTTTPTETSISDTISPATLLRAWNPGEVGKDDALPDIACEAVVDELVTDSQGDSGKFTGIVAKQTRLPHGVGRMVYVGDKRIYEGFWANGDKEGHGRCLFTPQGDFHEGEYHKNLRHGPGRYVWNDGRTFVGNYLNDLRHGHGVFVYPSGDRYEGSFAEGARSGHGKFVFEHGSGLYEGEWDSGKYHGKGILSWREHTGEQLSYEGEFEKGLFHGVGVKRDAAGVVIEEGLWSNGRCQSVLNESVVGSVSITTYTTNDKGLITQSVWHEPEEHVAPPTIDFASMTMTT